MARPAPSLLIRRADIAGFGPGDVRIEHGRIAAVAPAMAAMDGEEVIDARGSALLPGLHDHHIHLAGLAVRAASVFCGPPKVDDEEALRTALARPGTGWIRAIGYHESVLGTLPTAMELDRIVPDRPLRMQHRSGRMWLFNSVGLDVLLSCAAPPPGLEREAGQPTGRLFDEDDWLRATLGSRPPDFTHVSRQLASFGVTGLTDMSVHNDAAMAAHFTAQRKHGALLQHCVLAGRPELAQATPEEWELGPVKLHLHEAELPDFDATVRLIDTAHDQGRAIAVHCVSEVELIFALAALETARPRSGDRIEHASVTSPELLARMAQLGLGVCSQPHFIAERGDRYLLDVEPRHHADLYRLASLASASIALAGGSDAPFGQADPWAAMRAAVSRRTMGGAVIGPDEALTPEAALGLFLADPHDLGRQRRIAPGAPADLCLLDRPWNQARQRLLAEDVAMAIASGRIIHDRVNQPPGQGLPR